MSDRPLTNAERDAMDSHRAGLHAVHPDEACPACETEACGCPRQGRPDGDGWHLDSCLARVIELDSRVRWTAFMGEQGYGRGGA